MMPREGAIFNDVIGTLGAPRAALLTFATAFLASISAANSEDEALIRQLAEFEKTQGLITGYTANKEDYHLDVTISSTTPLPKGEATLTGRTTCYLGTRGLGVAQHAISAREGLLGNLSIHGQSRYSFLVKHRRPTPVNPRHSG